MYDSINSHDYEVMAQTHAMLNETKKSDFVEMKEIGMRAGK